MLVNMKMRETLERIRDGVLKGEASSGNLAWIVNLCDEVLAMPLRNCDVYNTEACDDKWWKFCLAQDCECDGCPLLNEGNANGCKERFAEMPYEEGNDDGSK